MIDPKKRIKNILKDLWNKGYYQNADKPMVNETMDYDINIAQIEIFKEFVYKDSLPSVNEIIEKIKCQDNLCKHLDDHAKAIRKLIKGENNMFKNLCCSRCGKRVSTPVPKDTTVRAWIECPECIKNYKDNLLSEVELEKFAKNLFRLENGLLCYNRKPFNYIGDWFVCSEKEIYKIIAKAINQLIEGGK